MKEERAEDLILLLMQPDCTHVPNQSQSFPILFMKSNLNGGNLNHVD
jgi:hypothetical protein